MPATVQSVQPVLMVGDVPAALAFYAKLGFEKCFVDNPRDPRYAGVRRGGAELHLQWHDAAEFAHKGDRPNTRFVVDNPDALYAEFLAAGALSDASKVMDTPWGTREFHVRDPYRNGLQFYCAR
ncbi:MAG: VOC family protein [Planctomycetes bacterium]|nr:VOC family protein [Planctomycetota bacterium]